MTGIGQRCRWEDGRYICCIYRYFGPNNEQFACTRQVDRTESNRREWCNEEDRFCTFHKRLQQCTYRQYKGACNEIEGLIRPQKDRYGNYIEYFRFIENNGRVEAIPGRNYRDLNLFQQGADARDGLARCIDLRRRFSMEFYGHPRRETAEERQMRDGHSFELRKLESLYVFISERLGLSTEIPPIFNPEEFTVYDCT